MTEATVGVGVDDWNFHRNEPEENNSLLAGPRTALSFLTLELSGYGAARLWVPSPP